jgi:hypothetical protein
MTKKYFKSLEYQENIFEDMVIRTGKYKKSMDVIGE